MYDKEINNLFLNKYGKIMGLDTASGKCRENLKKCSYSVDFIMDLEFFD